MSTAFSVLFIFGQDVIDLLTRSLSGGDSCPVPAPRFGNTWSPAAFCQSDVGEAEFLSEFDEWFGPHEFIEVLAREGQRVNGWGHDVALGCVEGALWCNAIILVKLQAGRCSRIYT
jgi:hypothetical protein